MVGPPSLTYQSIRLTKSTNTNRVAPIEALNMITLWNPAPIFLGSTEYDHIMTSCPNFFIFDMIKLK